MCDDLNVAYFRSPTHVCFAAAAGLSFPACFSPNIAHHFHMLRLLDISPETEIQRNISFVDTATVSWYFSTQLMFDALSKIFSASPFTQA